MRHDVSEVLDFFDQVIQLFFVQFSLVTSRTVRAKRWTLPFESLMENPVDHIHRMSPLGPTILTSLLKSRPVLNKFVEKGCRPVAILFVNA